MQISDTHLRSFLADAGLLSGRDFDAALREAEVNGKTVGDILLSKSAIGEDELRRTYAYILGVPFVSLLGMKIPFETLALIPEPVARRNNTIAFSHKGGELEVAMLDTDDLAAIEFIKKKSHLTILPRITDADSIKFALKHYQHALKESLGDIIGREVEALSSTQDQSVQEIARGIPAVRIVDTLLRHANAQGASDIHLEPSEESLLVRYRIDGILHDAMQLPKHAIAAIAARIKALAALRLDHTHASQEGRFGAEAGGERISLRVSVVPTYFGEKIVLRLVRNSIAGFTLESIGVHGATLERLHDAMRAPSGLVLVSGHAGSGISTTLYTLLDIVNTPEVNIATIEDGIEYQMPRVNQTEVRPEIGFSYASGLRALMRQDTDIIMIGKLVDKETATLAVNAALNGRLVLAGVNADSAAAAISLLIEIGVEPFLLASALRAVVGQCLVRRLGAEKNTQELSRDEQTQLEQLIDAGALLRALKEEKTLSAEATWKNLSFSLPKETAACPSGYEGQTGIYEVLLATASIKDLIAAEAGVETIEGEARAGGMLTMMEDGIGKAVIGMTSIEEVLRAIGE